MLYDEMSDAVLAPSSFQRQYCNNLSSYSTFAPFFRKILPVDYHSTPVLTWPLHHTIDS